MLRFRVRPRPRKLSSIEYLGSGPEGRLNRLRKIVTGLLRHERIELPHGQADEARGYAERLIQIAMKNGDRHKPTMEMANYWLLEKDVIHKLFKVLVPRYSEVSSSFTQVYNLPTRYPGPGGKMALLELKDNPWPPIKPRSRETKYLLSNVLLGAARKDYYHEKKQAGRPAEDKNSHSVVQKEQEEDLSETDESSSVTFSSEKMDKNKMDTIEEEVKNLGIKPT